jgi:putative hemolysin
MDNGSKKIIDLEEIIKAKNSKLAKSIPGFLMNYMKRLIHQDEINRIIYDYRNYHGLEFVQHILEDMNVTYSIDGFDNIPGNGRYIFASNHPLGGFDGLVLMDAIGTVFPNIRFIVNDLLLSLKNFDPLFVPVNKHGRQSPEYARKIEATYSGDTQVLYFPAGLCSRKIKGKITDPKWNKSFIQKAVQYKRDIVPVYFEGRNSDFFYNLANLRKTFRIKANIEMIFLVDEFFKQKGRHLSLKFNTPIPYTAFDKSKTYNQWAGMVREKVYATR